MGPGPSRLRTGGEFHLDFSAEIALRQRVTVDGLTDFYCRRPVDRSQDGDEWL